MEKFNFEEIIKRYSPLIEKNLEKFTDTEERIPNLHDGLRYALALDILPIENRGKRIRPILCLLTCESLGGEINQALNFAAAIEIMHNFFLIHDDIEDGDKFRRDNPCVYIKYGLSHGINIGDYMFTKVFQALIGKTVPALTPSQKLKLIKLAVDTLDHTHIGQAMDINARHRRDFTIEEYMTLVTEKTGYYLAAPIIGGAIIAGASKKTINALAKYGKYIGPLFQIIDDIIDLTSGKGRKEIGSDIKEGKRSFLVAFTADKITVKDKHKLFAILDKPREKTIDSDISWAIDLFEKTGAVKAGEIMGQELLRESILSLKNVPEPLKSNLISMAEKMLHRKK